MQQLESIATSVHGAKDNDAYYQHRSLFYVQKSQYLAKDEWSRVTSLRHSAFQWPIYIENRM